RDEEASGSDDILKSQPASVASGRDMDDIAADGRHVWRSGKRVAPRSRSAAAQRRETVDRHTSRQSLQQSFEHLHGARRGPLPARLQPQLATLVKEAPAGHEWLSEIKFDGYRMIARVDSRQVTLSSRNQLDWTARLEHLVKAVRGLGLASGILDGEVVALEPDGRSSFQALQNVFSEGQQGKLVYYLFDLVYLNGKNLMHVPLEERKRLLAQLLKGVKGPLRYSDHVVGHGPEF